MVKNHCAILKRKNKLDINQYISNHQKRIESFLDKILPKHNNELHMAMRYSTLGGGKRIRPLLTYATGEILNADPTTLDYVAAAVELVHSYSLIHDDLPAMDDDAIRRGKPSCHKAFNEAIAILAGDALLSFAFEILTAEEIKISAEMKLHLIQHLAKASGASGMVLGQALDLYPEDIMNIESIVNVHLHKTGLLIQASVLMGAHAAKCDNEKILNHLSAFAQNLGLAYQIQDDILDLEASAERIEAVEVSDKHHEQCSYSFLLGTEGAEEEVKRYYKTALENLSALNLQNSLLADLTKHLMNRDH